MSERIIDTHLHIWDLQRAKYPWLAGDTSILNRSYTIEELGPAREEAGVTEAVLVQASGNAEDTALMFETAATHDWITGVVAWLPLRDPQATAMQLEWYKKNPLFKGVRHQIHDEQDARWLLQPSVIESLKLLEQEDIPYDLVGIRPVHIRTALDLAERVPGLRMIFDHLNQPPVATGEKFGEWGELMKEASALPQFRAKISGLGTTTGRGTSWSMDDIRPYVEFILDHFGTGRCMLGGDWPVALLAGSYTHAWSVYRSLINELLPAREAKKIFSENAVTFYGL
ncbi:amidohydrolase family protein [Nostoc ellipsosporum NOK]|nr:amidohydrolase family protein [Nostoc ellipsosporum NOK]